MMKMNLSKTAMNSRFSQLICFLKKYVAQVAKRLIFGIKLTQYR